MAITDSFDVFTDKTFKIYYEDLSNQPVLTPKEERELLRRYNTCPRCETLIPNKVKREYCTECGADAPKDTEYRLSVCTQCSEKFNTYHTPPYCLVCGHGRDFEARETLVNRNLRFVVKMAKTITKDAYRIQQLTSAGNVGLLIATDKFDISQGTRFLTYAAHWIRKEMFDEIQSSGIVHVPSHKQKSHRKIQKNGMFVCRHCDLEVRGDLCQTSALPKCTEAESHEFLPSDSLEVLTMTVPLDANPNSSTLLSDDTNSEENLIDASAAETLRIIISKLSMRERDKFILLQYYNIPEESRRLTHKSLHQLAVLANITPERVRQIKERLLNDVRIELRRMAVNGMDDLCTR
jgi:RNA polymerase sigma factor (sigma-70 family)